MGLPAEIGSTIRDYKLDSVLGQGGMGCVFAATHTTLGRKMALKVLAPELASSQEYVSRFRSEARIVNGVRHPNIVDISDFIIEDGCVAYVMEYVDGPSLGGFLREGAMSVRQAVNVTFQLASALEAVHAVGVVHRDLKPDNVLVLHGRDTDLSGLPSVKILDFGIAKCPEQDVEHKTVTGSMLGTPSYMAPEQVAAEPVSAATDVYALAELLYEMVSGQRLFTGDRMDILRYKLTGDLPELAWPDVPGWEILDDLVRRGLHPRPEQRLTIVDLVMGLNEVLAQQPDAPTPTAGGYIPGSYVPSAAHTPTNTAAHRSPSMSAHTPVNMHSVVLEPPNAMMGRLAVPMGTVLLLAAGAVALFAVNQNSTPDGMIDAKPVAAIAATEPPSKTAVAAPVVAEVDTPKTAEKPVVKQVTKASPKTVAKQKSRSSKKKRRARRRRAPKAVPAPVAKAEAKAASVVVKKSELVQW